MCPGCLGYALGEEPDLANMTLSISTLEEGDDDDDDCGNIDDGRDIDDG